MPSGVCDNLLPLFTSLLVSLSLRGMSWFLANPGTPRSRLAMATSEAPVLEVKLYGQQAQDKDSSLAKNMSSLTRKARVPAF